MPRNISINLRTNLVATFIMLMIGTLVIASINVAQRILRRLAHARVCSP